jgi:type VI secretion system Hcp family effector
MFQKMHFELSHLSAHLLVALAAFAFLASGSAQTAARLQFTVSITSPKSVYFQGVSFSHTITETMTNTADAATAVLSDFVVTKAFDASSSTLYEFVSTGAKLPTVVISVLGSVNGAAKEMWRITLTDATIKSVTSDPVNSIGGLPSERVTFGYNKLNRLDTWSGVEISHKNKFYTGN